MSVSTATAVINLQALANNYQTIKTCAPNSKVLAVLKANAYGHGLERIAKALPQADAFGVARIGEAILLREAGITQPIVLLEGFFSTEELLLLVEHNLQTVIHNAVQLKAITENELKKPLKVWLKVDSGMHRLGINPEEFEHFFELLSASHNVQDSIVLMSHLGCADDTNNTTTSRQTALFNRLSPTITSERSLANSAGICAWPDTHYDWVRPGLMLYGISPMLSNSTHTSKCNLSPVMTLKSSLIAVRGIQGGESVGYGSAWTSVEPTTIGVIAIGYGDGYPRHAKNGTPVYVNGRVVPIIGRVSMDMVTVNLGVNSNDKVGDEVTLWGAELPVETVADHATTIPYELLCNISRRVHIIIE
jgi:alanine racemase